MNRLAAAALAALVACGGRKTVPVGARIGPALAAALTAADRSREPWRCAAPDGPSATDETITTGGHAWRVEGRALRRGEAGSGAADRAGGAAAIGVIADAAGSAPATLAALGRLRGKLAGVDVVLSLGGMGSTVTELDAVFAVLADRAARPVVALPGDLEPVLAMSDAIAAARRRGAAVIDGRLVQRIELPGATIALLPGAGAASRLVAGADGCAYRSADVAAVFAELTARPGLRILASAEAPRRNTDPPTGELAITVGAGQQIDLALHGPGSGAATAARSGGRDGAAVDVTPGSSDATPRLPDARRVPSAGVLTIRGSTWTWQPVEDVADVK